MVVFCNFAPNFRRIRVLHLRGCDRKIICLQIREQVHHAKIARLQPLDHDRQNSPLINGADRMHAPGFVPADEAVGPLPARSIACPSSRVKNGRSHATHKAASERIALSTLSSAPNGPQPGRRSGTSRQSAPGSSDGCCVERSFSEKKPSSPARYRTSVLPRHGRSALSVPIRREAPPANSAAQIVCSCMPRSFASVTRPLFVSRDSRK